MTGSADQALYIADIPNIPDLPDIHDLQDIPDLQDISAKMSSDRIRYQEAIAHSLYPYYCP